MAWSKVEYKEDRTEKTAINTVPATVNVISVRISRPLRRNVFLSDKMTGLGNFFNLDNIESTQKSILPFGATVPMPKSLTASLTVTPVPRHIGQNAAAKGTSSATTASRTTTLAGSSSPPESKLNTLAINEVIPLAANAPSGAAMHKASTPYMATNERYIRRI